MKKGFTLIELLVVIAIIAILAAILFPVFAQAKTAAKQAQSLTHMRELSLSVMIYAGDYDDNFVPASARSTDPSIDPIIWTQGLQPYVKNKQIFSAPDSNGGYAENWASRRHQSVGYSDATGVDPASTAVVGNAPAGTEGFTGSANFSQAEFVSQTGLFALTANAPKDVTTTKHRGYVFNPYNGLNSPDGDYYKGLPLISDRDLVVETGDANYPTSPSLSAGALKPIYARIGSDKKNGGRTPIVFADGHAKVYTAKALNGFGTVIWRFR
ncbi:MAG: prepilin-type N-terminal cleavage/methylation domain-containing protein [Fimbriimonadaceae bacterium]|nr:MAG: prepilin-type N-terminal cleavage/methylation domain-containing protein [Fimbriimonadaceae bacterium]